MEIVKFMFKVKNKMFFISFFTDLNEIHKYITRQKTKSEYYHHSCNSKVGRKRMNHEIHKYITRQKTKSEYYHHSCNSKVGRKRMNH